MMKRRDLVAGSIAGAFALPRALARRTAPDRPWIPPDDFLADLPRLMGLASVPGLAISVVENGAVAWTRAVGLANADTKEPVLADSVFPAASLGKPVAGYVALRMVDQGKLELDRPLIEYFRPADLPAEAERITARHVLSHTTGLRNWRNRVEQKLLPDFPPGTRFQYSGEGFYWLAEAMEAVTGQGFERVMRTQLFEPAGMPRATYGWSRDHARWTVAGHTGRGAVGGHFSRTLGEKLVALAERSGKPMADWTAADTFRAIADADPSLTLLPNSALPNAAASLLCTAPEYAKFMTLLLSGRKRAPWEINEATRANLLTRQVELKPTLGWGLGLGLEARNDGTLFWHWGDNGIFKAFMLGDPARRRGIVVFTNGDGGPKVYQRIIRAATGLDLAAFLWV